MYTEICKTLIKENIDTDSLCFGMEIINIKMSDHSKQSTSSVKSVQWYFFTKIEQIILTFVWNNKDPNSQRNWSRNKPEGIMLPDFKLYYKVIIIKQYGIGIKADTQINGREQRPQK